MARRNFSNATPAFLTKLISENCFTSTIRESVPRVELSREKKVSEGNMGKIKWIHTKYGTEAKRLLPPTKNVMNFTVVSYNVLAQCLLEEHMYLYARVDPTVLRWEVRCWKILETIQASNADVICLQEVQADHYEQFFMPKLHLLGFRGIYKKRTSGKMDGCAIFYNISKFELLENTSVEYFHADIEVLSKDNIGLIAVLIPRHSVNNSQEQSRIVIATTHLLYNPRRHDIKLAQLQVLFAELDRIAFSGQRNGQHFYHPTILTGDFNFTPECSVFQFVSKGFLRFSGLGTRLLSPVPHGRALGNELVPHHVGITDQCQHLDIIKKRMEPSVFQERYKFGTFSTGELSHRLKFRSVYSFQPVPNPSLQTATTYQNKWVVVDHIFHSCTNYKNSLKLVGKLEMLNGQKIASLGGLPSVFFPSDHLPIGARFLWTYN